MRLRDGRAVLARAVDVSDDVEVVVESNACAERPAGFASAAKQTTEQAGHLHEAQILEVHDVSALRRLERFGFRDGVLCPGEIDASEVGFFRSQRDWSFLGLVADVEAIAGINFWPARVDRNESEESRSLDHTVPLEGIDH